MARRKGRENMFFNSNKSRHSTDVLAEKSNRYPLFACTCKDREAREIKLAVCLKVTHKTESQIFSDTHSYSGLTQLIIAVRDVF